MSKKTPKKMYITRKVTFFGSPEGRYARVVLPPEVIERLELKEPSVEEKERAEERVVFIIDGELVILANLRKLAEEFLDEMSKNTLKLLKKKWELTKQVTKNYRKWIDGEMDINEWNRERNEKEKELNQLNSFFARISTGISSFLSERELRFTSAGNIDQFLSAILIEEEEEKEEDFLFVIGYIKQIKEDVNKMNVFLKNLEEERKKKKLSSHDYEILKERFLGKLTLAQERLKKIRSMLI